MWVILRVCVDEGKMRGENPHYMGHGAIILPSPIPSYQRGKNNASYDVTHTVIRYGIANCGMLVHY
jgi:hypothetical protein